MFSLARNTIYYHTKIFFFETSFSIVNATGFCFVIESPIRNSSLWWSSGFLSLLLWLCNLLLYSTSSYCRRPPFRGPYQGKEDAAKVEKKEDDEDNWDMPEDAPFWVYLAFNPHFRGVLSLGLCSFCWFISSLLIKVLSVKMLYYSIDRSFRNLMAFWYALLPIVPEIQWEQLLALLQGPVIFTC